MSDVASERATLTNRIVGLDLARSCALLAMAVFHFTFDLQMFGLISAETTRSAGWRIFAQAIAGSFLFLAGFSLYLAHGRQIRFTAFFKRLAVLLLAAGAVTLGTWVFMPQGFIFFGILHMISVASVLGLLFLRLPPLVTGAVAVGVIVLPQVFRADAFNTAGLLWVGLSTKMPYTLDYEPVFPWLAPFLFGIVAAKLAARRGVLQNRGMTAPNGKLITALALPGRHSLLVYLLHQPVLIGLIWVYTTLRY